MLQLKTYLARLDKINVTCKDMLNLFTQSTYSKRTSVQVQYTKGRRTHYNLGPTNNFVRNKYIYLLMIKSFVNDLLMNIAFATPQNTGEAVSQY